MQLSYNVGCPQFSIVSLSVIYDSSTFISNLLQMEHVILEMRNYRLDYRMDGKLISVLPNRTDKQLSILLYYYYERLVINSH